MDNGDALQSERIAALWQAIVASKTIKLDRVPSKIEEGLYLGSLGAANNMSGLKSLNITHVLTIAGSFPPAYPNDFVYKIISISDREDINIFQYFNESFHFIEEAKKIGGVLVHCAVGRSRSVTIVVAYLMKKHGMSFSEAFQFVKSKRPMAGPNTGFISQLKEFEKTLIGEGTAQRN